MPLLKKQTLLFILMIPLILGISGCSKKQVILNDGPTLKKKKAPESQIKANIPQEKPEEFITFESGGPELYTVQEGDTLWDISSKFLRDPWHWPEIWYKNPQIKNPHLIFPGDQLAIIYVEGQKRVQLVKRGETFKKTNGLKVVKISPKVHSKSIDSSIPSIPIESIRQFLSRPILIDEQELADSAYILSSKDNHLTNSTGDIIYVRGLASDSNQGKYHIFRPNKSLKDPKTDEVFGYESLYLGDAKIIEHGDPASLQIISSTREILRDDRLIPINNTEIDRDFFPKPVKEDTLGEVISILDGISQVGQFKTIAINLGTRDDIQVGNIVQINHLGSVIRDRSEADPNFLIKLPDERAALALVIKSYEKMSYCLVLEATLPIKIGDFVISP